MMTKEVKKKEESEKKEATTVPYFYAVGRRKTAIAQVKLYAVEKAEKGIEINNRKLEEYLAISRLCDIVKSAFSVIGQEGKFDATVKVCGGGISAQAEAIRLGIARALVKVDKEFKKSLRDRGFLTRDARVVERKKPGLKKARKSPQWAKR